MSITTGIGDKGTTRLFSGDTVSKSSARPQAYGDLDEVVSHLGVARSLCTNADTSERLMHVQRELFVAGTELATPPASLARMAPQRIDAARLAELDRRRTEVEAQITMPKGFIIPGGTPVAAHIDVARAVARRCERRVVALAEAGEIDNPALIVWMNRLSDYLWLLARREEGERVVEKNK